MLAPLAPSAFVCLRCEVQLARRLLPSFARQRSHPTFSTSARQRHDGDAHDGDALAGLAQLEPPPLKITRERQLLDRVRRRKGKTIRETSARLGGIKTLGDDAEILVLKELADQTEPDGEEAAPAPTKMARRDIPDIAASLHEEGRSLTNREVHQQIEKLRPKIHGDAEDPQYVSQLTFVKLMTLLTKSFTASQLSAFYSIAKNVHRKHVSENLRADLKGDRSTVYGPIQRSEWNPGTTNVHNRLPELDLNIRPKKKSISKRLLVDRILRDCWKMVLLEEMEAPGEIELSLQPWQIELLTVGESETVLDKIGQARRAKLDLHREDRILRITADKTTAEYAANDVEEALQKLELKHLDLRPWLPLIAEGQAPKPAHLNNLFPQNILDTVSVLTRTTIETVQPAMLTIRGLDANAVAEAERTLLRFLPLKDLTTHSMDSQMVKSAKASTYLVPVFLAENTLDQKDRKAELARNCTPIARSLVPEVPEESEQPEKLMDQPAITSETYTAHVDPAVAAMHRSVGETSSSPAHGITCWPPQPEYFLTAELGQALFPLNSITPTTSPLIFHPSTPGLTSFLTSPHFTATTRMKSPSLIYDFIPSPTQIPQRPAFKPGQLFPDLRIQMRTGRAGSKPYIHALTLSFDKRVHNVLLPSKPVDLRFRSSARLSMKSSPSVDAVQEWVEKVVENIESGGRLSAPQLTLSIPNWTIPGAARDATGLRQVTYLFSGVQYRQSVSGVMGETHVAYRTTQAGKLGAKTGMLSAHYSGNGDVFLKDQDKIRGFVEEAFVLVERVAEGGGTTVPVGKMLNPRAVVSARKIRRGQEQALARAREEAGEIEGGGGLEEPSEPSEGGKEGADGEEGQKDGQLEGVVDEATQDKAEEDAVHEAKSQAA